MSKNLKIFDDGLDMSSKEPLYIGVDQSYSGFAITLLRGRTQRTTVYKGEGTGVDRLKNIKNHLTETLITCPKIEDAAMEGYAFGSQMANMLGELGGMVKLVFHDFGIYPLIVPPTNLKKYVTGKGNGIPKSQMLLYVYKKWGVDITDDNGADSYSLARLVSGSHTLEYEKDVYDKLQDKKFRGR